MSQIMVHVEKNTNFTRMRLNRKEEDLVTNHSICINCESIMNNTEFCQVCCFQYDRKPGAITGGLTQASAAGTASGYEKTSKQTEKEEG